MKNQMSDPQYSRCRSVPGGPAADPLSPVICDEDVTLSPPVPTAGDVSPKPKHLKTKKSKSDTPMGTRMDVSGNTPDVIHNSHVRTSSTELPPGGPGSRELPPTGGLSDGQMAGNGDSTMVSPQNSKAS